MDAEFQGAILNQSGQQLYKLVSRQFLFCSKEFVLNQKLLLFSPLALEQGTWNICSTGSTRLVLRSEELATIINEEGD
jgi:hypothetical protein